MDLDQLRISDLKMLSQLSAVTSLRELARRLNTDPQNLTKRMRLIESSLSVRLIERCSHGITLTSRGHDLVLALDRAVDILQQSFDLMAEPDDLRLRTCGRAFMVDFFLYRAFRQLKSKFSEISFDFMDLSPESTERAGRKGLLDLVFSFGDILMGENFTDTQIGPLEWHYIVGSEHPLSAKQNVYNLDGFPLVGFCYIESGTLTSRSATQGKAVKGSRGSGAENSRFATRLVTETDSVAYLPLISVVEELETGRVRLLRIEGHQPEVRFLHLHCNKDTVPERVAVEITGLLSDALKRAEALSRNQFAGRG